MKRSRFNVIHYRIVFSCICDEYEAFLEFLTRNIEPTK